MTHYNLPHDHGQDVQVVLERMPAAQRFEEAAMSFQQLGDPTRLKILWILCHCRECVSDIAAAVGMSDAAVSHHLQLLRRSGLIVGSRVGKEIHYTLSDERRAGLLHRMMDALFEITCPREDVPGPRSV